MDTCTVCCSPYRRAPYAAVTCDACHYTACVPCVEAYMRTTPQRGIHCMACRREWDHAFMVSRFRHSFLRDVYQPHMTRILFREQQRLFPETQLLISLDDYYEKLNKQIHALYNQIHDYAHDLAPIEDATTAMAFIESGVADADALLDRYMELVTDSADMAGHRWILQVRLMALKERRSYLEHYVYASELPPVMRASLQRPSRACCRAPLCPGVVYADAPTCTLCDTTACWDCAEEAHAPGATCRPEARAQIAALAKDSRPCPSCRAPITKDGGCATMFCVACHAVFDWETMALASSKDRHESEHYNTWVRLQLIPLSRTSSAAYRAVAEPMNQMFKTMNLAAVDIPRDVHRPFSFDRKQYLRGHTSRAEFEDSLYRRYIDARRQECYTRCLRELFDGVKAALAEGRDPMPLRFTANERLQQLQTLFRKRGHYRVNEEWQLETRKPREKKEAPLPLAMTPTQSLLERIEDERRHELMAALEGVEAEA